MWPMTLSKRRGWLWILLGASLVSLWLWRTSRLAPERGGSWRTFTEGKYFWKKVPVHYPPASIRPLPSEPALRYPRIQIPSPHETAQARSLRLQHRQAVKDVFVKGWTSYKRHAWTADELAPVSGGKRNPFGGWATTLVDALDTLWIMDLQEEFDDAVEAAVGIDFTHTDLSEVNALDTNVRHLGGFLAAYDLSHDARLLHKAVEVGEMLYKAFDTPNRMPVTRWDLRAAARGERQVANTTVFVAEVAGFSLEFTRLSQLTGDPKWYDAAQRVTDIMAQQQNSSAIPGLWPSLVDAQNLVFHRGSVFALGATSSSAYEHLPKMSAMLGGRQQEPLVHQLMYEKAADAAIRHNLFRPMIPGVQDILIAGIAHADGGHVSLEPQGQHLACSLGGSFALGSKLYGRAADLAVAEKLVDGCIWTYKSCPHHVMPEAFQLVPCSSRTMCEWDETAWENAVLAAAAAADSDSDSDPNSQDLDDTPENLILDNRLPPGFSAISDRRYILRPEAIESVFVLYRATKRQDLLESAWDMFNSINRMTSTALANTAVWDVTISWDEEPAKADAMESFWLGETLKYFYLIFSDDSLISLDEWVFNSQAHPLLRTLP